MQWAIIVAYIAIFAVFLYFISIRPQKKQQKKGKPGHRQNTGKEHGGAHLVAGEKEKVLGIAHRSGHTPQVGCRRLEHHHIQKVLFKARSLEDQHGERNKGQKGHIVCHQHGGKEAQKHQNGA